MTKKSKGEWIKVTDRLPKKTGWYDCKYSDGGIVCTPYSKTLGGSLVWVVPNSLSIMEWLETDFNKQ